MSAVKETSSRLLGDDRKVGTEVNRLSVEDAAYLSGFFERCGGLTVSYYKGDRSRPPRVVGLRIKGTYNEAALINRIIGSKCTWIHRNSKQNVKLIRCNTGKSTILSTPLEMRWGVKVLRELLPQLKFKTKKREEKRLEIIAALEGRYYNFKGGDKS